MTVNITHAEGCPGTRVETTHHETAGIVTHHCLDCAAHVAVNQDGTERPTPVTTGPFADVETGAFWNEPIARRATEHDSYGRTPLPNHV